MATWNVLAVKPNPGDDKTILGFCELEYFPGPMDAPLVQTRGVKGNDGNWKNYPNVVLKVERAVFKSACLKAGEAGKGPYLSIIGWETPRDGLNDLAKHCVELLNGTGRGKADNFAEQAEEAVSGGKRSPRRGGGS